jgi:Ca2+-binding RTX toxin-like protein
MDVLEGGAGDDVFVLSNDGAKDIIIVGQGDDIIRGGDANDRIVLRTNGLYLMQQEGLTGGQGLGALEETSAIPLLGGFGWPDAGRWYYESATEMAFNVALPVGLEPSEWYRFFDLTRSRENAPRTWAEYASYNAFRGVSYTPFGFNYFLEDQTLRVRGGYIITNEAGGRETVSFSLLIEDFEEGDYGIHFYDLTPNPTYFYSWIGDATVLLKSLTDQLAVLYR